MRICPDCGEENPDRFRLCGFCGTPLAPSVPAQEVRKTVTVVFCDLKDSTALGESIDPESLREVMHRYFAEMREILQRHGGLVEKYIGDAIMAVFGLPRVHEDDALRAVRAAADMQRAARRTQRRARARLGRRAREPHRGEHRRGRRRGPRRRPAAGHRGRRQPRRTTRAGRARHAGADRRADVPAGPVMGRRGGAAAADSEGQERARAGVPPAGRRPGRARGARRPARPRSSGVRGTWPPWLGALDVVVSEPVERPA